MLLDENFYETCDPLNLIEEMYNVKLYNRLGIESHDYDSLMKNIKEFIAKCYVPIKPLQETQIPQELAHSIEKIFNYGWPALTCKYNQWKTDLITSSIYFDVYIGTSPYEIKLIPKN